MSAVEALKAARVAGVGLRLDGGDLVLEAAVPPPDAVLDLLSRHKPGIVALLRSGQDDWSAEDWLVCFDERAGIVEFDGGLPRTQAEGHAFACCVAEWLKQDVARSPSGSCPACGGGAHVRDPLLPVRMGPTSRVWLHPRCWPGWHGGRKVEAVTTLTAMGIEAQAEFPDDFGKIGGA